MAAGVCAMNDRELHIVAQLEWELVEEEASPVSSEQPVSRILHTLVMGRNLPAVDATCYRIMGINSHKIEYFRQADQWLGPIHESLIE
jgi:hypothetical protein